MIFSWRILQERVRNLFSSRFRQPYLIYELRRISVHGVGYPGTPARPEFSLECSLPVVRPAFHTACDRWIGSKVLLHGTPAKILDRGAPLDDAGDRSGPTLGRLLEGVSDERARCRRAFRLVERPPIDGPCRAIVVRTPKNQIIARPPGDHRRSTAIL